MEEVVGRDLALLRFLAEKWKGDGWRVESGWIGSKDPGEGWGSISTFAR
jgi:hypothetical protein